MANIPSRAFYWYFRPIALFSLVLGIFPIQNLLTNDPKNLKVSFISLPQIYSFIAFYSMLGMIGYTIGFVYNSIIMSVFLAIVVYTMFIRSILCFIFCAKSSKKLPTLIRLLHTFDLQRNDLLIHPKESSVFRNSIRWTIAPIIVGILIMSLTYYESRQVILEAIPHEYVELDNIQKISVIFFGLLTIWQTIPLLLYVYFTLRIKYCFELINTALISKGYVGNYFEGGGIGEQSKNDEEMASTMAYLRFMHDMLSYSVAELGRCYGNFMAIDQLCVIAMVVINICAIIYGPKFETNLAIVTTINCLVVLTVLLVSDAVKQSGCKVVELLSGIQFSSINDRCRIEIQTFMIHIAIRPVEVSASGFFIIDKQQIPAMLSAIASYLVILIQFSKDGILFYSPPLTPGNRTGNSSF